MEQLACIVVFGEYGSIVRSPGHRTSNLASLLGDYHYQDSSNRRPDLLDRFRGIRIAGLGHHPGYFASGYHAISGIIYIWLPFDWDKQCREGEDDSREEWAHVLIRVQYSTMKWMQGVNIVIQSQPVQNLKGRVSWCLDSLSTARIFKSLDKLSCVTLGPAWANCNLSGIPSDVRLVIRQCCYLIIKQPCYSILAWTPTIRWLITALVVEL